MVPSHRTRFEAEQAPTQPIPTHGVHPRHRLFDDPTVQFNQLSEREITH